MLKVAFLLAILFLAGSYTYLAFADLNYLSSAGRLGPGFFPRIIGVLLIVLCLYSLYADGHRASEEGEDKEAQHWRDPIVVAALSLGFVALLDVLGGLVAMILYMFASLSYLNRRSVVVNAIIAVALPACVYVMFQVWLNAAMPRGMLPLPL